MLGGIIEPFVVVTLLLGGTWINRNTTYRFRLRSRPPSLIHRDSEDAITDGLARPTSSDGLLDGAGLHGSSSPVLSFTTKEPQWRIRLLYPPSTKCTIKTPNTAMFKHSVPSKVLRKLPFLVEVWYWILIYFVYQLARAITAMAISDNTVDVSRNHALMIIDLEDRLGIFWELPVQHWFLQHPALMMWTNRVYSFIHIPGSILFLVWLFYYTHTSNLTDPVSLGSNDIKVAKMLGGPQLYEKRRRTMAMSNLTAFLIFSLWPCMPPRLLSDPNIGGEIGEKARSYGFVDTVHGKDSESSIWTQNKFCNQYAAMPSLHFGYSLLIGLTIMSIPFKHRSHVMRSPARMRHYMPVSARLSALPLGRVLCIVGGISYPTIILVAVLATANHFILDAVVGAAVCLFAWFSNELLTNLLPLEDYFLSRLGVHKPDHGLPEPFIQEAARRRSVNNNTTRSTVPGSPSPGTPPNAPTFRDDLSLSPASGTLIERQRLTAEAGLDDWWEDVPDSLNSAQLQQYFDLQERLRLTKTYGGIGEQSRAKQAVGQYVKYIQYGRKQTLAKASSSVATSTPAKSSAQRLVLAPEPDSPGEEPEVFTMSPANGRVEPNERRH